MNGWIDGEMDGWMVDYENIEKSRTQNLGLFESR